MNKATEINEDPSNFHKFKIVSLKRQFQVSNMIVATKTIDVDVDGSDNDGDHDADDNSNCYEEGFSDGLIF